VISALVLLAIGPTTWFVSPGRTGDDANEGTSQDKPFKSLSQAVEKASDKDLNANLGSEVLLYKDEDLLVYSKPHNAQTAPGVAEQDSLSSRIAAQYNMTSKERDQMIVHRLDYATSGVVVFLQFALFLGIGVLLAAFHGLGGEAPPTRPDEVFATFIVRHFPANTGLIGLLLAAILAAAMSTIASSLNASASSMIHDFWLPLREAAGRREPLSPAAALSVTRWITVGFGLIQIAVGIAAASFDSTVVSRALTIAGYSAGLLLGVFVLGVATRRVGQGAALAGAAAGLAALLVVQFVLPVQGLTIAWPWYALIGSAITFAVGLAASLVLPRGEIAR